MEIAVKIRKWHSDETNYLLLNSNKMFVSEIAKNLNRNIDVVKLKMKKLNLTPLLLTKKWTIEDHEFIKNNTHLSRKELALKFNTSVAMISRKIKDLCVIRDNRNQNRSLEFIKCKICKNEFEKTKEFFYLKKNSFEISTANCINCERLRVRQSKSTLHNYLMVMLRSIKSRRMIKKSLINERFDYDIDLDFLKELYLKQHGKCAITGIVMEHIQTGKGRNGKNISIDRINNDLGYVKTNVQFVCDWANVAKGSLTMEDFKTNILKSYNNLFKNTTHEI
jgi:DNA-binding transcriptional regulator YiaG